MSSNNFNSEKIMVSPAMLSDEITCLRKRWIDLNKKNKFLRINSLNSVESLILINRISASKGLAPIGLSVQFATELGCNANCIMCNTHEHPGSGRSYQRIMRLLDYIDFPTVSCVNLVNGEPLMNKDGLVSFMKKCFKKQLKFSMTTNALFLSRDCVDSLVKNGLDDIVISLDSCYAQEHDYIRGVQGLFGMVLDVVKYIKQEYPQVKVHINSVIMKTNFCSVPGIIALANKLEVDSLGIIYIIDNGKNFEKLKLTELDKIKLEKIRHSPIVTRSRVPVYWDMCNPIKKTGCVYGYYKFTVFENGKIALCHFYDIKNPIFLNKPLQELFLGKEMRGHILSRSVFCDLCATENGLMP